VGVIGAEGVVEVPRVGMGQTRRGCRYPTEVRKTVESLHRMAAFPLLTLLATRSDCLGRVREGTLEVFGHYCPHHPD